MVSRKRPGYLDSLLLEARGDVASKSRSAINRESAWRWAALAVAAADAGKLTDAVDYFHEAIEHAALADPSGSELLEVRNWVGLRIPPSTL